MECLISEHIYDGKNSITVNDDEFKHVKALRLSSGDQILITNGKGQSCLTELFQIHKDSAEFLIIERYESLYENLYKLGLGMPVLDNKDRFEFAIEKAVELGVTEIIPIYSKFTQKFKVKHSRIEAKVHAALKQCKRSRLPKITDFQKLTAMEHLVSDYDTIVILDESGVNPSLSLLGENIFVVLGPEGGFSQEELTYLKSLPNSVTFNLGIRRLRSETAAIRALSVINEMKR